MESASILEGRSYGFVNFNTIKSAANAKEALDGIKFKGCPLSVKFAKVNQIVNFCDINVILRDFQTNASGLAMCKLLFQETSFKDCLETTVRCYEARHLQSTGRIESVDIKRSTNCAFIQFESVNQATSALEALQGHKIAGWPLRIGYSIVHDTKQSAPATTNIDASATRHLFIGNLTGNITEEDLRKTFSPYGDIEKIRILYDKGFGFIDFTRTSILGLVCLTLTLLGHAVAAKNLLENFRIRGVPIVIKFAKGEPSRNLWVGSVGPSISDDRLRQEFGRFGKIERFVIKR
jgi:RNA recognition motif-containing protein